MSMAAGLGLSVAAPGQFELCGNINFENSPEIEYLGAKKLLADSGHRWAIDLKNVSQADSSALSVLLSWIRLAQAHDKVICFDGMPKKLHALAEVCNVDKVLDSVSCTAK